MAIEFFFVGSCVEIGCIARVVNDVFQDFVAIGILRDFFYEAEFFFNESVYSAVAVGVRCAGDVGFNAYGSGVSGVLKVCV